MASRDKGRNYFFFSPIYSLNGRVLVVKESCIGIDILTIDHFD